ncbi:MAG: hypothetical protein QOJ91_2423, partial [Sphingomonadales bacterium]|nr:hypothetical protein [Sphingomonadales bacterium]
GGIGKFDEYGQGGTGRFRYTGQYWLGEANLLYYRARIYDPRLGRFLQPDPIGYGDGMAMYAYVKGDPVNFNDPTGLELDGPDVIITGIRVNAPAEIIDSGAMGAASAGLRSVGGTVGAAPGGRPVGPAPKPKAKPKPKPKKKGPACPAPSNVSLTGTIVAAPAGPAYFSGTLKDVSTGRTYSVNGSGYGGGFIVGTYDVTGTVKGFDALSNGIDIVFAQGPYGTGGASFTDNNGRSIGEGSVDGAFAPPIGAGGVSIDPPVVAETDSGNC